MRTSIVTSSPRGSNRRAERRPARKPSRDPGREPEVRAVMTGRGTIPIAVTGSWRVPFTSRFLTTPTSQEAPEPRPRPRNERAMGPRPSSARRFEAGLPASGSSARATSGCRSPSSSTRPASRSPASTSTRRRSTRSRRASRTSSTSARSGSPRRSRAGSFQATTDFDRLAECDAIIICVPTPLGPPPRAGQLLHPRGPREEIAKRLRRGPARRPRVDHLPGHDRRGGAADPRDERPRAARRTSSSPSRPSARIPGNAQLLDTRPSPRSSAA